MIHNNDIKTNYKALDNRTQNDVFGVINSLFFELTRRESEVLFWLSYGHDLTEISKILNISPDTLKTYLKRCKSKLNTSKTHELKLIFHCRYTTLLLSQKLNFPLPTSLT